MTAAWNEFRQTREAELAAPFGWLCLRGFHWLPNEPGALPGLPGLWWQADGQAFVQAQELAAPSPLSVAATERKPWCTIEGTEVELLNRGDRYAIRLRAASSSDRESFTGVPTWPYDPAWVIEGTFTGYDKGSTVQVETIRPGLTQTIRALGEVRFAIAGEPQRLLVTSIKAGCAIEFHDATNGRETPAWRQLKFDDPDETGRVVLDFNRTIDMWFAFTDYATCPKPVPGNVISVPVTAGERSPKV